MPRKGPAPKRKRYSDPVFNNNLVQQLANRMMDGGKKNLSQQIVYNALEIIKKQTKEDPIEVLNKALDNVKPQLEVRSRRVGGATYQVPVEVNKRRSKTLAMRWLVLYTRERTEKRMEEKLAAEIIDASNNTGASIKKKEDLHKMAEANRAFAHYRW